MNKFFARMESCVADRNMIGSEKDKDGYLTIETEYKDTCSNGQFKKEDMITSKGGKEFIKMAYQDGWKIDKIDIAPEAKANIKPKTKILKDGKWVTKKE